MKKIILLFIFIFIQFINVKTCPTIDTTQFVFHNDSLKITAVIFIEIGSCIKCLTYPEQLLIEASKLSNNTVNIVAMLNCNRPKEVNGFREETGWSHSVVADIKRSMRKRLGLKPTSDICLVDSSGRVLVEINSHNDYKSNLDTLVNALKKE